MTRTVRNSHTLSRRLHRQGGPLRSPVDISRTDAATAAPEELFGESGPLPAADVPNDLPQELPNELPNELPSELANELPNEMANELANEMADGRPDDVANERPDRLAGELSDELPGEPRAGLTNELTLPDAQSRQPRVGARGAGGRRAAITAILLTGDLGAMVCTGMLTRTDLTLHATICLVTLLVYAYSGLYRPRLTVSILDDLPRLGICLVAGLAVASILRTELPSAPPAMSLVTAALMVTGLIAARAVAYAAVRWLRLRMPGSVTVILGTGQVGCRLGQAMLQHPQHGLRLVGYLDDQRRRQVLPPAPLLGQAQDLGRLIAERGISHVVVTFGAVPVATLVEVVRTCDRMRCEILLVPRLFELHAATRDTEHVQGLPLVRMRRAPFRRFSWRAKRATDIVVSAALMVGLAPVLLGCALAVRLEGGPGVLFRQERVGLDGRRFQMLKFRSLKPSSEVEGRVRWTIARDPRIGPVGRLLRATSLDELPQLVNVLRGDMSLVGPRPERPHFVDQLSRMNPRYQARLRVPAGLTGWAAVNGLRGDTSIVDRVQFDNAYIQSWSLWLDIKILVRTIGAVLGRTGG
jgi:exopolysaccharide biosynthesis polyprenyl glycosylphosphotransferase